jgi:hypothetical protein
LKQEIVKHSADGAVILAISTGAGNYLGWFDFINQNAAGIGVIISFLSFIVAVVFYILTYRKPDNSRKNTAEIIALKAALNAVSERRNNLITKEQHD